LILKAFFLALGRVNNEKNGMKSVLGYLLLLLSLANTATAQTPVTQWTKPMSLYTLGYGLRDLENDGVSEVFISGFSSFRILNGTNGMQKREIFFQPPVGDWSLLDVESSQTADLSLRQAFVDFDRNGSKDLLAVYHSESAGAVICQLYDITTKTRRWQSAALVTGVDPDLEISVANVDADNAYEIVLISTVTSSGTGMDTIRIRVLDGATGAVQWTKTTTLATALSNWKEVMDLENDGISEIGISSTNTVQFLQGATGAVKWQLTTSPPASGWTIDSVDSFRRADLNRKTFADLNANGAADMIVRWQSPTRTSYLLRMYQISTKALKWQKTINAANVQSTRETLNVDNDNNRELVLLTRSFVPAPSATIIIVDGATGATQWSKTFSSITFHDVLDIEADGTNEVYFQAGATMFLCFGSNGAIKWQFTPPLPAAGYSGTGQPWLGRALRDLDHPTIKDATGDGQRDILVQFAKPGSANIYQLFSIPTKTRKWSLQTTGFLGPSANADADPYLEFLHLVPSMSGSTLGIVNGR
jgi:hypothetical protein